MSATARCRAAGAGLIMLIGGVACASSGRWTPPSWVSHPPSSPDSVYLSATCTSTASRQEARNCARRDALTQLGQWLGGTFESRIEAVDTGLRERSRSIVRFDAAGFLAGIRRREVSAGVAYRDGATRYTVALLWAYPRLAAERERRRLREVAERADRQVRHLEHGAPRLASAGQWGAGVDSLVRIASRVLTSENVRGDEHARRLRAVAATLVEELSVATDVRDRSVVIRTRYRDTTAAGVPVQCAPSGREAWTVRTDRRGRARCRLGEHPFERRKVHVRPLAPPWRSSAGPSDPAGRVLETEFAALLDRDTTLSVAPHRTLSLRVALESNCGEVRSALRARLDEVEGWRVRWLEPTDLMRRQTDPIVLHLACARTESGETTFRAVEFQGDLMLRLSDRTWTESVGPVRGLGAGRPEARRNAAAHFADRVTTALRDILMTEPMP